MKYSFFVPFLILWSILFSETLFAQTYDEYLENAKSYCDSSERTWAKNNTMVPLLEYPEFTSQAVNTAMVTWRSDRSIASENERLRIRADLDPVTIGEFAGFKTLEIARIGYRSRMNSLFACGVITSRIDTIENLEGLISQKIPSKNSEILQSLKKTAQALKKTQNTLKCNPSEGGSTKTREEMIATIINSSSLQYCHYTHYLRYLETQTDNINQMQSIEKDIGNGAGTPIAKNLGEYVTTSNSYQTQLNRELERADITLPKAIRSLIEMDQSYGVHILLTFIYDDYIRLRSALSQYMNLSSQLYQKANNAQNANMQ